MLRYVKFSILLFIGCLTSCFGAGTLGGFDCRVFPTSKEIIVEAIDTLYARHPEYRIPDKWKQLDDWSQRGYDFLDSRIFYFSGEPEEMYYVSFVDGRNRTAIAIRAVENGNDKHWMLEDQTSRKEKKRIENRFDEEIVSKLEEYSQITAFTED